MRRGMVALGFSLATAVLAIAGSHVRGADDGKRISSHPLFLRDVAPILDKKGCSTAGCHGKFGGRGGFQLSLLTLTPMDDYDPIVRGARGRRVNTTEPEKSLLLLKATGVMGHAGGERFAVGSPEWKIMRDWIAAGAPYSYENDPKLARLTVTPNQFTLSKVGQKLPLKVVATFTDGISRDVTAQANYDTNDPAVFSVDGSGIVTGKRWGGTSIVVRYLGDVQAVNLSLPRDSKAPFPKLTSANFIDDYVYKNLKRMNVVPSRKTTDAEFLRRVALDLCGKLPAPEEIEAFAADKAPDKRAKLIDQLLDSPDYVAMRTLRLGDLLRIHPNHFGNNIYGDRETVLFTEWVKDAVTKNMPHDQFVKGLLMARGSTFRDGPANFWRVDNTPEDRMETVAQAFLGQRMACARCHKHPFDRWTTDDYWNFTAFMGKVGVGGGRLDGENTIFENPDGRVINQSVTGRHRGKEAPPTLLGADGPSQASKERSFNEFVEWTTSRNNPFFAKATVNRLWGNYMGRGVVHPVDDMRATTPASVPGLLEAMAKDLTEHNFDIKRATRLILNSNTYQASSEVNETNALDTQFFSHFYPRPMLGQVLLDSINQATGTSERFGDYPADEKASHLYLPVGSYFMDTFGRSHREFLTNLEPKIEPTLVQTLHVLNSPYIDNKVRYGQTLQPLINDKNATNEKIIRTLYLKTFGRNPTDKEKAAALAAFTAPNAKRDEVAQDLLWALISAREFYFVS
ncbi:MAG: DUF1549 domain-containing protein [Armatimonas sp.]